MENSKKDEVEILNDDEKESDRKILGLEGSAEENEKVSEKENRFDGLNGVRVAAYSVGHFINDLTSACWFNYLLFYLRRVLKTAAAPSAILSGQICDGLATPIVGILSDKITTRFGQRKPWYVAGFLLVLLGFIPIFSGFTSENPSIELFFYTFFPGLFNIGWAALQISHMSLVPSLTCSRKRRDLLNNRRNIFSFISNVAVLGLGLIIFPIMPQGILEYSIISYVVISLGVLTSVFFIYNIDEVELTAVSQAKAEILRRQLNKSTQRTVSVTEFSEDENTHIINASPRQKGSVWDWFKMPKFYLFGVCYMGVRLYTNVFGTLLPFYLTDVIGMAEDSTKVSFNLALVPMIVYASSVVVSFRLNWFYEKFGRKTALLLGTHKANIGTIICIICLTSMFFLTREVNYLMYILAILIGASQSMVLSTGINLISDVVGTKGKSGAIVFGIYSLLDKFSAGAVIFVLGNTQAYSTESPTSNDISFIKYTMVLVPGLSCILAASIVLTYPIQEYKKKKSEDILLQKRKSSLEEELVL